VRGEEGLLQWTDPRPVILRKFVYQVSHFFFCVVEVEGNSDGAFSLGEDEVLLFQSVVEFVHILAGEGNYA